MVLINNWLNGNQNFIVGRILYNQYGQDATLKALLAKGEKTPGAKAQLLAALQALVGSAADKNEPAPLPAPGKQKEDTILKALQLDWKSKYKKMQYYSLQLDQHGKDNSKETKAACLELCKQILSLEQEVMEVWKRIDYYKANGKLPDIPEKSIAAPPADPAALAKKIETVKRSIRRHKANLVKHPGNAKYAALIKQYEQALQHLTPKPQKRNGTAKKTI